MLSSSQGCSPALRTASWKPSRERGAGDRIQKQTESAKVRIIGRGGISKQGAKDGFFLLEIMASHLEEIENK